MSASTSSESIRASAWTPTAFGPLQTNPDSGDLKQLQMLDEEAEWSAFSRPSKQHAGCWESNLMIDGMHCAACALSIEDALHQLPGVVKAEVSSGSHRAKIIWDQSRVLPSNWMQAVQRTGYRPVPANDAFVREKRRAETRKALWRMMVAGLCMMQVMMYAYPSYVAEPGDLSAEMEHLLRWASWVLSLPVIFFSCGPFFASAWRDVMQRRISMDLPVSLGMLITFAVSTAGTFDPNGIFGAEVYFDSLTMFVFFLLAGRWFELRLRDKTAGSLEVLMNRLPDSVLRRTVEGHFERVALRRLMVSDVIQILPGEAFPADGLVLQGATEVDESLLTGESKPVPKREGETVIAGSHNLSGVVSIRVDGLGVQTRFSQIVSLMESASTSKPQIARLADKIAKPFLLAVLVAAALSCAVWWSTDPERALMVAVAVLVVTCPCALSLATPAAMLSAAGFLARRGMLVRRLDAFEALAAVDTVVFDKTGTLTQDSMMLSEIQTRDGVQSEHALRMAATLANQSLHPASRALVQACADSSLGAVAEVSEFSESSGQGLQGVVLVPWLEKKARLRLGSANFCGVQSQDSDSPRVYLSDEQGWLATFVLQEAIRDDAKSTVSALQAKGLRVHLLTGDTEQAAKRVANQLGIKEVKGLCTPQDKLNFLRQAQQQGNKVAVIGDGLNDGPVLAGAHVSFAFGNAVPLTQASADLLVPSQKLMVIAQAYALARKTMQVVKQNLWWAAGYNAVCVPLAIAGWLPAWLAGLGMASSSLLVVMNARRLSQDLTASGSV